MFHSSVDETPDEVSGSDDCTVPVETGEQQQQQQQENSTEIQITVKEEEEEPVNSK